MDFVDAVEVVSAVLRQLNARPHEELYAIQSAIIEVEEAVRNYLERNKYFLITIISDEVKKLLETLLVAVYKMEDCAETFVLQRMNFRRMGFGRRRRYIVSLRQMLNLKVDIIGCEMRKRSKVEIDQNIAESLRIIDELGGVIRQSHPDVVGLEEDKGKMVTWLTDTKSRPNLGFIIISGQTGSGKTTLAKEIYKDREIERHFQICKWVSASEDTVSNLQSILQQITGDSTIDTKSTSTELEEKICEILQKKRCLLVVDNVKSPYDLFKIRLGSAALSAQGYGSRVIMTIWSKCRMDRIDRFKDEHPSLSHHHQLQSLQSEDAWDLFLKKVRLPETDNDIQGTLKSKIIAICQGIPSAIVVLGRYLSTKKCYQEWSAVVDDLELYGNATDQGNGNGNGVSVSTILASMNSTDRTSGLRPCLLYFGLFPRGYHIPVRRLLRLWLAERFVIGVWETAGYSGNPLDAEETAVKYLKELHEGGLIETTKRRKDGSTKAYRMPGILHDICLSKTQDTGLLHIHPNDHQPAPPKFVVRRVAAHGDIKNYSGEDSHTQYLRSYLSFNNQSKDTPAVEMKKLLSDVIGHRGFGLLRVLDLEGVYKPTLPPNLGQLYLLRYLGLRWTFLDTLPDSVSDLSYLETLDVKHTYISSLPNSIWKMKYLQHLCLNEIRLDMPVEKHSISLNGLHTLWGLFVDNKSPVKNGLDTSINLRKLGLTFYSDNGIKELNDWITSLEGLKSLRLRSKDKNGRPSNLDLKPLSGLQNLTNLYLLGKLPDLQNDSFPHSIIVLTLSVSKQEKDPMPILAELPNLKVLRLLADSYTGKEMVCPKGGFQSLTILKLWMLNELEKWTVEENAMPLLLELEIRCCHKLKELPVNKPPSRWLCWKIILTNMPKEFVDNVQLNHDHSKLIPRTLKLSGKCEAG